MVQVKVKILYAKNYLDAEKETNEALRILKDKKIIDVRVDCDWANTEDHYIITILYED